MRAVVADAGPLYALFDPDDGFHVRARGEIERLDTEGFAIIASYPAVGEAHRLALRRLGISSANKWLDENFKTVQDPLGHENYATPIDIYSYLEQAASQRAG